MKKICSLILAMSLALSLVMLPAKAAGPDADSASPATREMFATALWRKAGEPVVNYVLPFADVGANAEYAEAVRWAASEKLMSGDGNGLFSPDGALTREQLAVILYRYARSLGTDVSAGEDTNILSYDDFLVWSDWAVEALQWAVAAGLLDVQDDGRLNARGTVSQAEAAGALEKFDAIRVSAGVLHAWTEGAKPKDTLVEYMKAITDPNSTDYIPVEDRIAVFDLDGTLMCETYPRCFEYMVFVDYALNNPDYTPPEEVRAAAREILDTRWQEKPSGISTRQAAAAAIAYAGMTPGELEAYVKGFMDSDAEGFTGLKRGEAFYIPMVQVVDFLEANGFTVYIVTATERNIVRALVRDTLGIPPGRVIGTEYGYTATGQGDTADGDYTFQASDKVVFDGNYYGENARMSKVDAIVREIGQQPVLAFGNSSGDVAMCEYVVANNPHASLSFIVLADDEAREWGDAAGAQAKIEGYTTLGIGTISMRDDFAVIYGPGVEKNAQAAAEASAETKPEAELSLAEAQSIGLTGVGNARELGGYAAADGRTVKRGVLLRTAALSGATDEDIRRLSEVYHLSTVLDLRGSSEIESTPDPEIAGVKNLNLRIMDEEAQAALWANLSEEDTAGLDLSNKLDRAKLGIKLGIVSDQMLIDFLSGEPGKEGYRRMFEELLALPEGEALLFHCSQGKDRTGCAAMLILSALGVDEETVLTDFLLTNTFNAALIESERQTLLELGYEGAELDTMMTVMDEVDPRYMINALDWMKKTYGSVGGYITEALGITDEQLETLRNLYLEE